MSEVDINYKNSKIAGMDASGTKTLLTEGKYCEDDIEVVYTKPTPSLQTKTATYTPTESQQTDTITADSGYDGLNEVDVTVDAVSSTYVGSSITRRSSEDLTVDLGTVTIPEGYYSSQLQKSIPPGSATMPDNITVSGSDRVSVTTDTNSVSFHATTTASPDITRGYVHMGTPSETNITLTAPITTKASTTYHPSSSATTIPAGTYLTGVQTIKAVAVFNLLSENVKSGVRISVGDTDSSICVKSVVGTYDGGGGGTYDFASTSITTSAISAQLSFEGLAAQPKMFFVRVTGSMSFTKPSGTAYYYVVGCGQTYGANGAMSYTNYVVASTSKLSENTSTTYPRTTWDSNTNTLTIIVGNSNTAAPGRFRVGTWVLNYFYEIPSQ